MQHQQQQQRPPHPMRQQSIPTANLWESFPGGGSGGVGGGAGLPHPSSVQLFNAYQGVPSNSNNGGSGGPGSAASAGIFPPSLHAPSGTSVMDLEVLSNQSASGSEGKASVKMLEQTPQLGNTHFPTLRSNSIAHQHQVSSSSSTSGGMTLKQAHANAIIAGEPIEFEDEVINLVDVSEIEMMKATVNVDVDGPAGKKRKVTAAAAVEPVGESAEDREEAVRLDIERRYAAGEKITPEEECVHSFPTSAFEGYC